TIVYTHAISLSFLSRLSAPPLHLPSFPTRRSSDLVAYAIVHMLPTDLLLNMGSSHGLAMVFSMLLAAIIWNLGTWYFGLPASSRSVEHTSELQSRFDLVCRLLLEKKKKKHQVSYAL